MRSLGAVIGMVAQRSLGHWRLFAALTFGSVLCAALMACVVLYSDAVRDLGLKYALENQPRFDNDIQLISATQKAAAGDVAALRQRTDDLIARHAGGLARERVAYARSATFFPTAPGEAVSEDEARPRAHLQFIDRLPDHVRVVAGNAPVPVTNGTFDTPPAIEAWLGKATADRLNIEVGREFDIHAHWRAAAPVRVKVVGIIEPNDISEDYWFGKTDRFEALTPSWDTIPFFVDEETFLKGVGPYLPDMDVSWETYVFIATGRIQSGNADSVRASISALKAETKAKITLSRAETTLDTTIGDFEKKLFFTRLPLFALMIQIVAIVMFYLVMVSTMVVERQSGEIALLKSRGAGTFQVLTVFLIEGTGITIFATIAGPLVAAAGVSLLGLTPAFDELSHGDLLKVTLTPLSFVLALGGGLLALTALVWPAYRACRYSITHYKQQISRPPRQSAFLRYYGDLVLVAAGAFAFYQLRSRGSFVTEGLFGDLSADPILLATPSLFMLMTALVFLRLFPLVLKVVLWVSGLLKGPTIALGLTRMARSPLQHSRLILLLLLATAVGMFAAGFRTTLERGYEDRAAYEAGAEGRIADIRSAQVPTKDLEDTVNVLAQTDNSSALLRATGFYSPERFRSEAVVMLGVQPDEFASVSYWRDDFAGDSLVALMDKIKREPPENLPAPLAIPGDARLIGVWAQNPAPGQVVSMGIRLRDADGSIWEFRLFTETFNVGSPDWRFYAADLGRPTNIRPTNRLANASARQWTFDGFFIQMPGLAPAVPQPFSIPIDDLQVSTLAELAPGWGALGFPDGRVIETFESIDRYELSKGVTLTADPGQLARAPAPEGRSGSVARMSFIRGRTGASTVGFRTVQESRPLQVVADRKFLRRNKLSVGDEITVSVNTQYITMTIVGSYKLFPTYDPERPEGMLVADLEQLRQAATKVPGAGSNVYANEAWLPERAFVKLEREVLQEKGLEAQSFADRLTILEEQSSDPLIAASWEGILFLAFAGVLIVSTLGFVIYAGLGAQARTLEFAILRTMGFSGRQILTVVGFEQLFVVVAGVAAGTLLGFPLSRLMISYMGLTEAGNEPIPPLVSVVSWQAIGTVYLLLGIVVVSTIIALVALYSRLAVGRALRMGEL